MKVMKLLAVAGTTGVMAAATIVTPALAWHPKGVIKKSVQNQTTNSPLSDANTAATAVAAKPGDTLRYVIEVSNIGAVGKTNEMHFTKMTDTLPAGVQLVSDLAKKQITEDLGVIVPGQKVTKEYLVKVVATKDAEVIENKACFTGDSEVKDQPQQGCDTALIKVNVPKEPPQVEKPVEQPKEQPKTEVRAEEPKQVAETAETTPQVLAAELPKTGAESFIAPLAAVVSGGAAYVGRLMIVKRRQK